MITFDECLGYAKMTKAHTTWKHNLFLVQRNGSWYIWSEAVWDLHDPSYLKTASQIYCLYPDGELEQMTYEKGILQRSKPNDIDTNLKESTTMLTKEQAIQGARNNSSRLLEKVNFLIREDVFGGWHFAPEQWYLSGRKDLLKESLELFRFYPDGRVSRATYSNGTIIVDSPSPSSPVLWWQRERLERSQKQEAIIALRNEVRRFLGK